MFFKKKPAKILESSFKEDFPALNKVIKGKPTVYFDNACVSLRPRQVVEKMNSYYFDHPSCARRSPHKFGVQTTSEVDLSRESFAKFIGARKSSEVIFTQNATEALNIIALGMDWKKDDVVVTSNLEHNSNFVPWMRLSETRGVKHLQWEIKPDGSYDLRNLFSILESGKVRLLSLFMSSHVLGLRLPVEEIIQKAHKHGVLVMLDAAQSLLHEKINVNEMGADFMAFSFHKALGPSGVGALYLKEDHVEKVFPPFLGGETVENVKGDTYHLSPSPYCYEAGLQNYAGVMGVKAAIEYLEVLGFNKIQSLESEIAESLKEGLFSIDEVEVLGDGKSYPLYNFLVKGIDSDELSIMLDRVANIMTRSGVHCCHSWYQFYKLDPSLRASVAFYNSKQEIEVFIETLKDLIGHHSRS